MAFVLRVCVMQQQPLAMHSLQVRATSKGQQCTSCLPLLLPPLLPLQSVGHLNLAHTKLESLGGLSGLSVINGDLIVWDNPNLVNLQGLGPVTQLFGKLWMDTNARLQDMTGLEVRRVCADLCHRGSAVCDARRACAHGPHSLAKV